MNIKLLITSLSLVLQIISVFFAIRLLLVAGRRSAGLLTLTVFSLMAFRRAVSFYNLLTGDMTRVDLLAEIIALIVSFLLFIGILFVTRLIISEKRATDSLKDSKQHYQTLFDQSPDGVLLIDLNGRITEFNDKAARDLGYTREEFLRLDLSDINSVETLEEIQKRIEDISKKGTAEFEVKHKTKGGDVRDVHVITQVVESAGKKVLHTIWRDITNRRAAETRIRETENKFQSIFDQTIDGIMIADLEQKRNIEANNAICAMLGYTREELVELSVLDMHPKDALPRILDLFERQERGEISLAPDIPMLRKDGTVIYADINAVRRTLDGKPCLIGVFRDITEQKKMVESLRAREKQLSESQRIAHIGSWEHNLTTGQVFWSDELFRLLGLNPETDPGDFNMFFNMIHPDDQPVLRKAIEESIRTGVPFNMDYRFIRKDGMMRIIHAQAELICDDTGTQMILSGTGQDITERKQTEEKIQQSEKFIRSILDTVDEGFIVIDRDFRILTVNKAYCDQMGGVCDEIIGRHCYEISHKTLKPCYEEGEDCAVRHAFATGGPHTAVHRHTDSKGGILYVETRAFPITDSSGAVISVIETVNNITEKHLLEEERLRTQKLEAIGTLAGGIAHDFNNLLQGVFGYISMAKITHDQKERSLAMLEQAEQALHLSVNLTTQLLTFSKGGKPVKKKMRLQPVIENSVKFALSGSRVDYRIKQDDDLSAVEADEGQISQVIQNIVLNADQAMPMGGTISVTVKNVDAPARGIPLTLTAGKYVEITIADTGIGISEQFLSKIFDPYFTTKDKGSGLGLATSYSIIMNHGGLIDVKSKLGSGTTFVVYIPAIEGEEEKKETISAANAISKTGKVLVMDDEEVVRNVVGIMIKSFGHAVEFAENGEEAIAKYRETLSSGRRYDIVILDLTIRGGKGGKETLQELIALDPGVTAVVSSGYSDDAVVAKYRAHGFSACLMKPYEIDTLKNILNALLNLPATA